MKKIFKLIIIIAIGLGIYYYFFYSQKVDKEYLFKLISVEEMAEATGWRGELILKENTPSFGRGDTFLTLAFESPRSVREYKMIVEYSKGKTARKVKNILKSGIGKDEHFNVEPMGDDTISFIADGKGYHEAIYAYSFKGYFIYLQMRRLDRKSLETIVDAAKLVNRKLSQ